MNREMMVASGQAIADEEATINPELPIIDPHHHFHVDGLSYASADLLQDIRTSGHKIISTVYLECGAMYPPHTQDHLASVEETRFVVRETAHASSDVRIAEGIVGYIDLRHDIGAVSEALDAHIEAAAERFRGIRHWTAWHAAPKFAQRIRSVEPAMLRSSSFRAGLNELAKRELSFDAWLYDTQLADVTDLAKRCPSATIVVDHLATPIADDRKPGERFAAWRTAMAELALCHNVIIKIGGLGMPMTGFGYDVGMRRASSSELALAWRPYVEVAIELFGVDRCCFESNFPVDSIAADYRTLWNTFKRIAAGYSPDERRALFSGTAARVYRLKPA